jgi:GNAT superfamily N-acetyltransferase
MEIAIHRLDAGREADFRQLHGWCQCVGWWVPTWQGWGDRTAAENAELRAGLFARGEHDGYLLYADGAPVGWSQVGPRDRLVKLGRPPDADVWAVTCFLIAPGHRRRGLASRFLGGILDDLRRRGVRLVEAYPKPAAHDDGEMWNGPLAMFQRAGFTLVEEGRPRAVYALRLGDDG